MCPCRLSAAKSCGVRMAATEPVTPSSTLAISPPPAQVVDGVEQTVRQFGPRDTLVAVTDRPEKRPLGGRLQRVGHHQVGVGLAARSFGHVEKLLVADADFKFELHERAAKAPFGPDGVDQ